MDQLELRVLMDFFFAPGASNNGIIGFHSDGCEADFGPSVLNAHEILGNTRFLGLRPHGASPPPPPPGGLNQVGFLLISFQDSKGGAFFRVFLNSVDPSR